jgi:hypothetical protein
MELHNLIDLIAALASAGPTAVIFLLVLIVGALLWDRKQLVKRLDIRDDQVLAVLKDYHSGALDLTQALGKIEIVLGAMKERL